MTENGGVGGNVYLKGTELQIDGCDIQPGKDIQSVCEHLLGVIVTSRLGGQGTRLCALYLDSRKYVIMFLRVPL